MHRIPSCTADSGCEALQRVAHTNAGAKQCPVIRATQAAATQRFDRGNEDVPAAI